MTAYRRLQRRCEGRWQVVGGVVGFPVALRRVECSWGLWARRGARLARVTRVAGGEGGNLEGATGDAQPPLARHRRPLGV